MSYAAWTDPPTPPTSQGIAKHGHFRHRHPGDCVPCCGRGFVEKIFRAPCDEQETLHYIRCRACKGHGSPGVF